MHNIFLVCVSDFYNKNKIFDLNNPANRDDYYYPYHLLRQEFLKQNISLNTYDYFNSHSHKCYNLVFFDIPSNINKLLNYRKGVDKFLVIFESKVVRSGNWDKKYNKYFKKIFTWSDNWVNGRNKWHGIRPAHLYLWGRKALVNLLRKCGFEILSIKKHNMSGLLILRLINELKYIIAYVTLLFGYDSNFLGYNRERLEKFVKSFKKIHYQFSFGDGIRIVAKKRSDLVYE